MAGCVMQDASLSMDRSTMRWEQALIYTVGALLFIGAAAFRFSAAWRGHCRWLHFDGAVARRRPAWAQGALSRCKTARGRAVGRYPLVPAKAGTQGHNLLVRIRLPWTPAFAGVSGKFLSCAYHTLRSSPHPGPASPARVQARLRAPRLASRRTAFAGTTREKNDGGLCAGEAECRPCRED